MTASRSAAVLFAAEYEDVDPAGTDSHPFKTTAQITVARAALSRFTDLPPLILPAKVTRCMVSNNWLFAAGGLSAIGAALHIGCVFGGPSWYRFLGAGEALARLAERGSPTPALYAVGIGGVLCGWSAYAFSGSGVLPRLPLLRPILVAICSVYLLRAAALPILLRYAIVPGRSASFIVWSSVIVLIFGIAHAVGILISWTDLKAR